MPGRFAPLARRLILPLLLIHSAAQAEPAAPLPSEARVEAWCDDVGNRLFSVSARFCKGLGLQPGDSPSVEGRALVRLDRAPGPR